jgi:hypothetical protein
VGAQNRSGNFGEDKNVYTKLNNYGTLRHITYFQLSKLRAELNHAAAFSVGVQATGN